MTDRILAVVMTLCCVGCGSREDPHAKRDTAPTEKPKVSEPTAETKAGHQGKPDPDPDTRADHDHDSGETRIQLKTDDAAKLAGLEVVKAETRPEGAGIVVTASIGFDATKRAVVNARVSGVVRAIKADVGTTVERGAALAVLDSPQVGADRSRVSAAKTRIDVAAAAYKREADLQAKGIAAMKDVLAAQQELEAAKSDYGSLTATLGAVGGNAGGAGYTLASPIAGAVVHRMASIGKLVGVEETLFEVVDTSTMWAEIDVPEDQLAAVRVGQSVVVTVDGLGDRAFPGTISYVSPEIDPRTRTARARAALSNPDGVLRANMFARARVLTGAGKPTVIIPSKAVQRVNDTRTVFVRISDREFEARPVELGSDDGATVEVTSGLRGGEDVVTQGAFLLKSEMLKASLKGDDD